MRVSDCCWVLPISSSISSRCTSSFRLRSGSCAPNPRGELPRRDVQLEEPQLAAVDPGVRLVELGLALPQRLHLRALQHDPGLERLEELVLPPGAPVRGDHPVAPARLAGGRPLGDLLLRPGHEGYEGTVQPCSACPATSTWRWSATAWPVCPTRRAASWSGPTGATRPPTSSRRPTPPPRPWSTRSTPRTCSASTGPPGSSAPTSWASSTPTPTPTPTPRRPTWPRRPTRAGTTCSSRCATPTRSCAATPSSTARSPRSPSTSPGSTSPASTSPGLDAPGAL